MQITPLLPDHLAAAAALVARRYAMLREEQPLLPARYAEAAAFLPRLTEMLALHPGVATWDGRGLTGFLLAWRIASMRGFPGIYSPEWANAASLDHDTDRIYQALYTEMAAQWVASGHISHWLTVFGGPAGVRNGAPGARFGVAGWQWLGFGYHGVDAIRNLAPAAGPLSDVSVRRATEADFPVLAALEHGLEEHLRSSPTLVPVADDPEHADMLAFVRDPAKAVFLAERDGRAVAYLRIQPANEGACTIIRDAGTASITGAYTLPEARSGGIAGALLNACLTWARDAGYERCAVDFEAMNTVGAGFWLKHFAPVAISLHRFINPAVRRT